MWRSRCAADRRSARASWSLRGALPAPDPQRHAGLVLLTSGSTGQPKRVPIRPQALMASAASIAQTLQLGPTDRAAHVLPMFHIGAIVDLFLAPLLAGGSVALALGRAPGDIQTRMCSGARGCAPATSACWTTRAI